MRKSLESTSPPNSQLTDDVTALVVQITPIDLRHDAVGERGLGERRIQVTVEPDEHAPAMARRLIERSFADYLEPEELDRAKLAISELATNAVIHGQGEITLLADLNDTRLMVEVVDQGSGFEHVVGEQAFDSVGGRGLNIVDAESSRWGMHEGTTHVWFEIERRPTA